MPTAIPGQYNTFIRNHEATGGMIVSYSRNPKEFRLSDWWQYKPVDKNTGLYMKEGYEESGRVTDSGASRLWPDGHPRPSNNGNLNTFEWLPYRTVRYEYGFNIGSMAASQATWDVIQSNSRSAAQNCMTFRTKLAVAVAQNTSNYLSAHTLTAPTDISGVTGKLDVSTVDRSDIKRTLDGMADLIRKKTLGAIKPSQLMVVVGPDFARKISVTNEIRDYLKQQTGSEKLVTGNLGPVDNYGLPDTLYDYKIVVEDAVVISQRKGASAAPAYLWDSDKIVMCARVGELESPSDAPAFSSFTCFLNEEMTVEDMEDANNRMHRGSIVDDFECLLTAPEASVICSDVLT